MLRLASSTCSCFVVALSLLAACTGGGNSSGTSSSPGTPASSGGTPGSSGGTTPGAQQTICLKAQIQAIEGSGSPRRRGKIEHIDNDGHVAIIDGIQYSTVDTVVFVNGSCGDLDQLGVGHVVTVLGDEDAGSGTGIAQAIFLDDDVAGAILAIDLEHSTLNVAGQTVIVTPDTVFGDSIRPGSLAALSLWNGVAISGTVRDDRAVIATRIDRWPPGGWQATGIVSQLDAGSQLFRVNQVLVRYTDAQLIDFPEGAIHEGDSVRVQGEPIWVVPGFVCCEAADGGINAAAIEQISYSDGIHTIALSGMVTRWNNLADFDTADYPVTTDANSKFFGVQRAEDLASAPAIFWLTVVGSLDEYGILHARVVVAENAGLTSIAGPITDIDATTQTVKVATVPVTINSITSMHRVVDGAAAQRIRFSDLAIGDHAFAQSYGGTAEGTLLASRLEQGAPSQDFYVQSWFSTQSMRRPYFIVTVGGTELSVETTSDTAFAYGHSMKIGCSCGYRTSDQFWELAKTIGGRIKTGKDVEIVGVWSGDHIIASKVLWMDFGA